MKSPITSKTRLTVTLTLREWCAMTERCGRGHLTTPVNLYIDHRGTAQCRACRKLLKPKTTRVLSFSQLKAKSKIFWSKVARGGEGCWLWKAGRSGKGGYGQFTVGYGQIGAHRAAQSLKLGRLVKGMACHKCGNPPCCRPGHLYEGTGKSNAADAVQHGKTRRGERSTSAKLTKKGVLKIRRLYSNNGLSLTTLARRYAVSVSNIDAIVRRITWKWL